MSSYDNVTSVMVNNIYPMIEKSLIKNENKFKAAIADFMNTNSTQIYDVAPYDVIYYRQSDIDKLMDSIGYTEDEIHNAMKDCFFMDIPYNPPCIKESYVIVCMMAIRYFLIKKKEKEAEITTIYLAFSGKFYASLFTGIIFPKCPPSKYRTVMDYVINNMLTDKYDLKTTGTMFGMIRKMCITWIETYRADLCRKDLDDAEIGQKTQQLRDREKKALANIAVLYYQAYENKNYLNYETDNLSDGDEFRITDNDSLRATRYTENTIAYLTTNTVNLTICNKCADQNIKSIEIKDIMESIIQDKENLDNIYRVVNILICDFMRYYPHKSVGSVDFIVHSLKMKPNTKDKYMIELKSIITAWLDSNSPNYRRRKSRKATATSYYKAIIEYFTLAITYACK